MAEAEETKVDVLHTDVFNLESLREDIQLGGKTLVLEPLNLTGVKQLIDVLDSSFQDLSKLTHDTTIKEAALMVLEKGVKVMGVLFPQDRYPFMTQEFLDMNMNIPLARHILERAVELNGLEDVYPYLKGKGLGAKA